MKRSGTLLVIGIIFGSDGSPRPSGTGPIWGSESGVRRAAPESVFVASKSQRRHGRPFRTNRTKRRLIRESTGGAKPGSNSTIGGIYPENVTRPASHQSRCADNPPGGVRRPGVPFPGNRKPVHQPDVYVAGLLISPQDISFAVSVEIAKPGDHKIERIITEQNPLAR